MVKYRREANMAKIIVEKPAEEKLKDMKVKTWPIWKKEISTFDWFYDEKETCYLLEGKATVQGKDGQSVSFGRGDLVTFPKGLACVWQIHEPVKKHYNFG